ncbi:FG-GAP-like repeat-containing protein [Alteromonas macleodii]|uniref:FG-GAP-like repeat-containing protein n=1 Tax=Alteromonas macleodii TaxID=28108 RepID=UPI00031F3E66|nr:FG-GAP-like repeat-containing protein [Alteromonas macleodii]
MNCIRMLLAQCCLFALIFTSTNVNSANYQTFEELLNNESLILSVDKSTLDEYGILVEGILVKSDSGTWSFSDYTQTQVVPSYNVLFSAGGNQLTQTYPDKSHGSTSFQMHDVYSNTYRDRWGDVVADQLIAAFEQGLIAQTPSLQWTSVTDNVVYTISNSAEGYFDVIASVTLEEVLYIPEHVVNGIEGGWQGESEVSSFSTNSFDDIRFEFGIEERGSTFDTLEDEYVAVPVVDEVDFQFGDKQNSIVHDIFMLSSEPTTSLSQVLEDPYTAELNSKEILINMNDVLFIITPIQKVNESVWTVLVEVSADGETYRFARELVAIDGSAKNFGQRLASNFPFVYNANINGRVEAQTNENGWPVCEMLFAYSFSNEGSLNRGISCNNNAIQMGSSGWTWTNHEEKVSLNFEASYAIRERNWIPLTTNENGLTFVLEYSTYEDVFDGTSGVFIAPRINYLELIDLSQYKEEYAAGGFNSDNDGDGISDSDDSDDDNDGMEDYFEERYGLNHLNSNDADQDADNDGLTNLEEFNLGTDPTKSDTDGDGVPDVSDDFPLDNLRTDSTTQLFTFTYTFDGNTRGTAGHELTAVVEGTLLDDNDTVIIANVVSASLAGVDYTITSDLAIRAANPAYAARMSLSGDVLDFWVCVQGFTFSENGGDCSFGVDGGFLISPYLDFETLACIQPDENGDCIVWAWAGIPELGDDYRDGDIPFNSANWSAQQLNTYAPVNDLNADGKSDLLWRSFDKGWNFLWTMDGVQTAAATPINVVQEYTWTMDGLGDYDGDGKSDILWRNSETGMNFVYLMDGASIKSRYVLNFVTAGTWQIVGNGDFNGDGIGDVMWRNVERGDTWFYLMEDGRIGSSEPSQWVTDLNYKVATTGDIDGDGDEDVIWRRTNTGRIYVWLMDGGKIASQFSLIIVNTDWEIAGAGDLDGDGTDDIILRNQVDGRNWAYIMKEGQISTSTLINEVADLDWQIGNIGDYDGDGKADLLWRNETASRNIIHLMNGTSVKSRGVLRPTDNSWQVAK